MVGTTVSHYRVLEPLGAGGMGIVYLAEDTRLHRKVALKFITDSAAGDPHARTRLQREAEAASALDHPNIATIYEVGDAGDQLFIAMAYYPGETLHKRIARGRLAVDEAAAIAEQIAEGLALAHAAGVVHRDLKPANIILTPAGQVKILDFGLAKHVTPDGDTLSAVTAQGVTVGTLSYMSPEQARAATVDQRTDIWALGVVLFEMLTGRLPFRGDSSTAVLAALLTEPVPSINSLQPRVPTELARLIERALEKDPAKRTLTAADIARATRQLLADRARTAGSSGAWSWLRRPMLAIPAAAVLLLGLVAGAIWGRDLANQRWARVTALPEITRLAEAQRFAAAVDLARQADAFIPGDPRLAETWQLIARTVSLVTDPPGAAISYADYGAEPLWHPLGTSPAENVRFPRGPVRVKIEKAGFATMEDVILPFAPGARYPLSPEGTPPAGMVRAIAPPAPISTFVFGLELPRVSLAAFWIDRTEVSNKDYKAFVDAGGYRRSEFWREPFIKDGQTLTWDRAMAHFRDATGRPGPAGWELGTYASGQDNLPVRGVSWYEASAYAAYAGKSLPTIYHWSWTASLPLTGFVIPTANFQSGGPLPVDTARTTHRFGTYDLAGNVKEWTLNETGAGQRYILGGGWDEPPYMFPDADARSPFDRAPNFGFRCVRYDEGDKTVASAGRPAARPSRDYSGEKPVGDELFAAYKRLYSYDKTDLKVAVEAVDDSNPDWRRELVSYAAAYGQERVKAYLYTPRVGQRPYQTVVYMGGSPAWDLRSSAAIAANPPFAFLLKSGRAVVFPLYKGTYERGSDEYRQDVSKASSLWRDYMIAFSKDLARTLDYVATRQEFDMNSLAYYGASRGGSLAPVMLALEPRIRTAVLWICGFYLEPVSPEVDVINFAPRMTIPTLMLSGRYDYNFPDDASSKPFFDLLGAPPDRKRRILYDTGHNLPQNESVKETLDWLDRELGPVK